MTLLRSSLFRSRSFLLRSGSFKGQVEGLANLTNVTNVTRKLPGRRIRLRKATPGQVKLWRGGLVTALALATVSPFTLDAMKRQRDGNQLLPTEYLLPELPTELVDYMFLLKLQNDWCVDHIVANSNHPRTLAVAIRRVCHLCDQNSSAKILNRAFPNPQNLAAIIDPFGWTALHYAVYRGHTEVVRLLLALPNGQDLAAMTDRGGWTALHDAALYGHTEVIRLLLALPNAQALAAMTDNAGWTALHWAAINGHTEVVRLLLDLPNAQTLAAMTNNADNTAYELANDEIKQILEPYRQNNQ